MLKNLQTVLNCKETFKLHFMHHLFRN